ncbi:MAG: hypothetical protein ABII82_01920 [Verrucomicrobiota bacterium]
MPGLIPVEGKDGWFQDPVTKEIFDIATSREDDKYDTVGLGTVGVAYAVPLGHELEFFRDVTSKFLIDTNFKTSRRIPKGEVMYLERVGLQVLNAFGNITPEPSDIKKIADSAYFKFQLSDHDISEGPAIKYPSGYGLAGNSVETDQGIVSIGTPATAAAAKLTEEQRIDGDTDVEGTLTFQRRTWAVTAGFVTTGAGTETPTLTDSCAIRCWLHGRIRAASTHN